MVKVAEEVEEVEEAERLKGRKRPFGAEDRFKLLGISEP